MSSLSVKKGFIIFRSSVIPHPCREIIKFLNTVPDGVSYLIHVILIEKTNSAYILMPLFVRIYFIPHEFDQNDEVEGEDISDQVMQFQRFIDQLCVNGELDYLHDGE